MGAGELLRWLDGEDPLPNPLPQGEGDTEAPLNTSRQNVSTLSTDRRIHEKTGIELIHILAGRFQYGENETLAKTQEFWIARYPVTNAQYKRFLDANPTYPVPFRDSDWAKPYNWDKNTRSYPADKGDHPVVLVSCCLLYTSRCV